MPRPEKTLPAIAEQIAERTFSPASTAVANARVIASNVCDKHPSLDWADTFEWAFVWLYSTGRHTLGVKAGADA